MKFLLVVALAIAASLINYYRAEQALNVAGRLSDLIRCYEAHNPNDSLMQELKSTFLYDEEVGTPIHLEDYSYCY